MTEPTTRGASSVDGPPPRKKKKLLRTILGILALLIIAAIVIGFLLARKTTDDAKKDVSVKTCKADPGGGKPTASGGIRNKSSKTSNYTVRIKFNDKQGNAVSEGLAPVKDVEANKTATWELTGDRSAKGPLTCEISGVGRTHLPGQ
jgi:flagellar basal body-associated protein FliL